MRMPISEETRSALALLRDVRAKVSASDDLKANGAINNDLNTLISVLESPVFQSILNIQDSLRELKRQVRQVEKEMLQTLKTCLIFILGSSPSLHLARRFRHHPGGRAGAQRPH